MDSRIIIAVMTALIVSIGIGMFAYSAEMVVTVDVAESPAPLSELTIEVVDPTQVILIWNGKPGRARYAIQGSTDGLVVIEEEANGVSMMLPVAPDTEYAFTISDQNDATNAVTASITTPEASLYNHYDAEVYSTYLAYVPDPEVSIYEQKRTGVQSIGIDELFENIDDGYSYLINMDVSWDKTAEEKELADNVLVMRTPDGGVFAWNEWPITFEGQHNHYTFSIVFNWYLEWYRDRGEMKPGAYTFEFYSAGLLIGKGSMRIN